MTQHVLPQSSKINCNIVFLNSDITKAVTFLLFKTHSILIVVEIAGN